MEQEKKRQMILSLAFGKLWTSVKMTGKYEALYYDKEVILKILLMKLQFMIVFTWDLCRFNQLN